MDRGPGSLSELDGVVTEHVRSSLLKLLVHAQQTIDSEKLEVDIRNLIDQIDGLQLAFDISRRQIMLPLEPVNVIEVAESVMYKFMKNFKNTGVSFTHNKIHKTPVLAHRASLARSLESMIHAALSASEINTCNKLEISSVKSTEGIRLGVYSDSLNFGAKEYKEVKNNLYNSSRPVAALNPSTAAYLYIAETLLMAMGAKFRTAIHNRHHGIATILPYSSQLQLLNL